MHVWTRLVSLKDIKTDTRSNQIKYENDNSFSKAVSVDPLSLSEFCYLSAAYIFFFLYFMIVCIARMFYVRFMVTIFEKEPTCELYCSYGRTAGVSLMKNLVFFCWFWAVECCFTVKHRNHCVSHHQTFDWEAETIVTSMALSIRFCNWT